MHFNKKIVVILPFLLFATAAYADGSDMEEYTYPIGSDSYGNILEDVDTVIGGDDMAGLERDMEDAEVETYSQEEQESVMEILEAVSDEDQRTETNGYLTIALAEHPEEWNERNILVTLYSGQNKEEIWLYRQNNWETRISLPIGTYTFHTAFTSDGKYEFEPLNKTFEITEDMPIAIYLREKNDEAAEEPQEMIAQQTETDPIIVTEEKTENRIVILAAVIIAIAVFIFIILLVLGHRTDRDEISDLLD